MVPLLNAVLPAALLPAALPAALKAAYDDPTSASGKIKSIGEGEELWAMKAGMSAWYTHLPLLVFRLTGSVKYTMARAHHVRAAHGEGLETLSLTAAAVAPVLKKMGDAYDLTCNANECVLMPPGFVVVAESGKVGTKIRTWCPPLVKTASSTDTWASFGDRESLARNLKLIVSAYMAGKVRGNSDSLNFFKV